MLRKCLLLGIMIGVLLLSHMAPTLLAVAGGGSGSSGLAAPAAPGDPGLSIEPCLMAIVLGGGVVVLSRQRRDRLRRQRTRS